MNTFDNGLVTDPVTRRPIRAVKAIVTDAATGEMVPTYDMDGVTPMPLVTDYFGVFPQFTTQDDHTRLRLQFGAMILARNALEYGSEFAEAAVAAGQAAVVAANEAITAAIQAGEDAVEAAGGTAEQIAYLVSLLDHLDYRIGLLESGGPGGSLSLFDNGDGSVTVTGEGLFDNNDGSVTITAAGLFDNGDGSVTVSAA